jgi:Fe2+ or Zn2+ uptake regulation protein
MTIRYRILNFLVLYPYTCTAAEIHDSLNCKSDPVKLSSLSSALKKMYDAGELERQENVGPRGGYGYRVK